jgi:hypothetical protein
MQESKTNQKQKQETHLSLQKICWFVTQCRMLPIGGGWLTLKILIRAERGSMKSFVNCEILLVDIVACGKFDPICARRF